jgi:hypothetical protein
MNAKCLRPCDRHQLVSHFLCSSDLVPILFSVNLIVSDPARAPVKPRSESIDARPVLLATPQQKAEALKERILSMISKQEFDSIYRYYQQQSTLKNGGDVSQKTLESKFGRARVEICKQIEILSTCLSILPCHVAQLIWVSVLRSVLRIAVRPFSMRFCCIFVPSLCSAYTSVESKLEKSI